MVITEEDVSKETEKPSGIKKAIGIWKKLWIIGAIIAIPLFFVLRCVDDEDNTETIKQGNPQSEEISRLVFSDFTFGSNKDDFTKMLENKGWTLTNSYRENDELSLSLEFMIYREATFQRQLTHDIVAGFDENNTLQEITIIFDVRPEALSYQGFTDINHKIQTLAEDCILFQGYKEFEKLRRDGFRIFYDDDRNKALFHFEESEIEKGQVYIISLLSN